MPVMVVGADTPVGEVIVAALTERAGEVRAFVSDPSSAGGLKALGAKVATGDLSDVSHLGSAAHDVFSLVLVAEAALDGRELAFAADAGSVFVAWGEAARAAGVRRAIWIEDRRAPGGEAALRGAVPDLRVIPIEGRTREDMAAAAVLADERE